MDNADPAAQALHDRRRLWRAFNASLAFVALLLACFAAQQQLDWRPYAVAPQSLPGLLGILGAPLLHGSLKHLAANATALLILGTLAGSVYPRATVRALPLLWIGGGIGAWWLGTPGSHHLGASGLTHALMLLLLTLGLLRRDRAAIATGMIAVLFYGSMLLTVLPGEAGISWQSHLGGALAGIGAGIALRNCDPRPQRQRYSWEIEEEQALADPALDESLEQRAPGDVPVLWQRPAEQYGVVLPFRRPDATAGEGNHQDPAPR